MIAHRKLAVFVYPGELESVEIMLRIAHLAVEIGASGTEKEPLVMAIIEVDDPDVLVSKMAEAEAKGIPAQAVACEQDRAIIMAAGPGEMEQIDSLLEGAVKLSFRKYSHGTQSGVSRPN